MIPINLFFFDTLLEQEYTMAGKRKLLKRTDRGASIEWGPGRKYAVLDEDSNLSIGDHA